MSRNSRRKQRLMNDISYTVWFDRLANICQNRFTWNIPETCDADMIERAFFRAGRACIFKDEIIGAVSLPFTNAQPLNIYGYPAYIQPYSFYCGVNYGLIPLSDAAVAFANTQRVTFLPAARTPPMLTERNTSRIRKRLRLAAIRSMRLPVLQEMLMYLRLAQE